MIRCRLLGHHWRPDRVHLFGVCRRCRTAKQDPHPSQTGGTPVIEVTRENYLDIITGLLSISRPLLQPAAMVDLSELRRMCVQEAPRAAQADVEGPSVPDLCRAAAFLTALQTFVDALQTLDSTRPEEAPADA